MSPGLVDYDDFFRAEFPKTVRYLMRTGASFEEAEDSAQEAMKALLHKWPGCEHPVGWVRTTAWRAYIRKAERDRKRVALESLNARLAPAPHHQSTHPDEYAQVLKLLRELPPRQREVLALALDGYGTDEIAELLDLKSGTVRSNLRHARAALRSALETHLELPPHPETKSEAKPQATPAINPTIHPTTNPVPETHSQEGGPHAQQG
ncbi:MULTISPECIES: sigma-70 family RNA polymerase sigma factor [unclassified Streptomyces]|uniref:RNA polymerase sigma factor n=1 Tax=unclassified Streptomyces TaxID=2593676 RepID=UPI0034510E2B